METLSNLWKAETGQQQNNFNKPFDITTKELPFVAPAMALM
jgi:hypothetical protein